jgi:hypothetical protein
MHSPQRLLVTKYANCLSSAADLQNDITAVSFRPAELASDSAHCSHLTVDSIYRLLGPPACSILTHRVLRRAAPPDCITSSAPLLVAAGHSPPAPTPPSTFFQNPIMSLRRDPVTVLSLTYWEQVQIVVTSQTSHTGWTRQLIENTKVN